MQLTRKAFIGGSAALTSLAAVRRTFAGDAASNPFRAADYAALRKQLRAFYPDWGQGNRDVVKDPRSAESYGKIEKDLKAWCAAHPDYDALDVRRECYMAMRRHFVPFLFTESPFYFEAGVNGGWGGKRPARIVNKLCWKFYKEKGLVPDEAFETLSHRRRNNLVVICGPFVDDLHHSSSRGSRPRSWRGPGCPGWDPRYPSWRRGRCGWGCRR